MRNTIKSQKVAFFLCSAVVLDKKIDMKILEIEKWEFRKERIGSASNFEPTGVHGVYTDSALDTCIMRCDKAKLELAELLKERVEREEEIRSMLEAAGLTMDEKRVIEDRYLIHPDSTFGETAESMNYSRSTVYRLHDSAIRKLEDVI